MSRNESSIIEGKDPRCCGNPVMTTDASNDQRDAHNSKDDADKSEQRDLLAEALEKWKMFQNERGQFSGSQE